MATKGEDHTNLLKCSICLDTFQVPKYLPCLHTFCESCVTTFVSSSVEGTKNNFKCPICRRTVTLGDLKNNIEAWAKRLPLNNLIVSMVYKQAMTQSEKLCDPCQFNTESVKAVSWCPTCEEGLCKSCEKSHRSFKISSSHVTVPLEEMDSDKMSLGFVG